MSSEETEECNYCKEIIHSQEYQWRGSSWINAEEVVELCKSAPKCPTCQQSIYHHLIFTDRNSVHFSPSIRIGYAVEYVLNEEVEKHQKIYCPLGNCRCCKEGFLLSLKWGDNQSIPIAEAYYSEQEVMVQTLLFSSCFRCPKCRRGKHQHPESLPTVDPAFASACATADE